MLVGINNGDCGVCVQEVARPGGATVRNPASHCSLLLVLDLKQIRRFRVDESTDCISGC